MDLTFQKTQSRMQKQNESNKNAILQLLGCGKNSLLTVYKSLIISKIDYGFIIYNSAKSNKLLTSYTMKEFDFPSAHAGIPYYKSEKKRNPQIYINEKISTSHYI